MQLCFLEKAELPLLLISNIVEPTDIFFYCNMTTFNENENMDIDLTNESNNNVNDGGGKVFSEDSGSA